MKCQGIDPPPPPPPPTLGPGTAVTLTLLESTPCQHMLADLHCASAARLLVFCDKQSRAWLLVLLVVHYNRLAQRSVYKASQFDVQSILSSIT